MNNGFLWWNKNKDKLGLVPALIFWVVSIMCFVFGLAFENPTGIKIGSMDLSLVIAFALGLANTIIQIVGNDQTKDEMGMVMWLGWISSYLFGIGSNVNFLLNTINLSQPILKILVCVGLGSMIEIMPERLFVTFLKTLTFVTKQNRGETKEQRDSRHTQVRGNNTFKPSQIHNSHQRVVEYEREEEPTYHPISMQSKPKPNVPPFLMDRGK